VCKVHKTSHIECENKNVENLDEKEETKKDEKFSCNVIYGFLVPRNDSHIYKRKQEEKKNER